MIKKYKTPYSTAPNAFKVNISAQLNPFTP
jgi:hypothetical protein